MSGIWTVTEEIHPMPKWTKHDAAKLRTYAKKLRHSLAPFNGWPRDARAWARRDRIEALLRQITTDAIGATKPDPARFVKVVEELREWLAREHEFIGEYPIFAIPSDWTRRELSPQARRTVEREWRQTVLPSRTTIRSPRSKA